MKHEFRHRITDAVILTVEVPDDSPNPARAALEQLALRGRPADDLRELRDETESELEDENLEGAERTLLRYRIDAIDRELAAPSAGAYLAGANLAGANLARANLARANLARANLARANLAGANLDGANLAGANLAGANLDGANLDRANLAGANLAGANLAGANLAGANLAGAYLANARNLPAGTAAVDPPEPYQLPPETLAAQADRAHRYREAHPEVPVVEQLDAKILHAVTAGGGTLHMQSWHLDGECGTTHCRAGWAIHLAGPAGYALERKLGGDPERAGAQIYMASVGFVPWFFAPDSLALEDIRRCAAEQAGTVEAEATPSDQERPEL